MQGLGISEDARTRIFSHTRCSGVLAMQKEAALPTPPTQPDTAATHAPRKKKDTRNRLAAIYTLKTTMHPGKSSDSQPNKLPDSSVAP